MFITEVSELGFWSLNDKGVAGQWVFFKHIALCCAPFAFQHVVQKVVAQCVYY